MLFHKKTSWLAIFWLLAAVLITAANAEDNVDARPLDQTTVIHQVVITKFKFIPANIIIKQGDIVEWINLDIAPHTATVNTKTWGTGKLGQKQTKKIIFTLTGTSFYICTFHPSMHGTVTVLPKNSE